MKNVFRREGQGWLTVYAGKQCFFEDYVGLFYVHELLALRPDQQIAVSDLVSRAHGGAGHVLSGNQVQGIIEALANGEVNELAAFRPDYLVPPQVAKAIRDTLERKIEELEQATDAIAHSSLLDEVARMREYLEKADSRSKFADVRKRNRTSVKHAISRAIKTIARYNPTLARHLGNSIHLGYFCAYEPEKPVDWSL